MLPDSPSDEPAVVIQCSLNYQLGMTQDWHYAYNNHSMPFLVLSYTIIPDFLKWNPAEEPI